MPAEPAIFSSRRKVLLYNPKAAFFDMPLALLAIGSALDDEQFEVVIVDGRISEDPLQELSLHAAEAVCLGVSVITGYPIQDALRICREMKRRFPNLPVVWGGWHTSLFPVQPLEDESCIDITVQGQGEQTFRELTEALSGGQSLDQVAGIYWRNASGEIKANAPRSLQPIESFRRVNYDLIDVEAYFRKKGRRQFDYISSTGCYFRCSFCSDPTVFGRKFTAVPPEMMVEDLAYYQAKYRFTDLNFQDETFFTYAKRIRAFAEGILEKGLKFTWAATMRADSGSRMDEETWEACKRSGLRRLLIGVESGSQEMMDWLKKDIKIEQVWWCAEKCRSLGIGAHFPFIVGFPEESDGSVDASLGMAVKLNQMSPEFHTPIFYFKPYPGSGITDDLVKKGYRLPATTEEWAMFDFNTASGPWVSNAKFKRVEALKFYLKLGYRKRNALWRPVQWIARWRCEGERFGLPMEMATFQLFAKSRELK